jgi:hypothetical protein
MVSVKFKGVAPGSCSWCGKEKNEVYAIETSDFDGHLCRGDLCNYLKLKLRRPAEKASAFSAPASRDGSSGSSTS